jgi:5-methylcytosine-specific restriction protein A
MPSRPPTLRAFTKPRQQAEAERKGRIDKARSGDPIRALYSSSRWRIARMHFLAEHPLCMCPACDSGKSRVTAATVVDHIKPHRGDLALFWDETNWQAMSKPCHDRKTATEDSRFARVKPCI